LMALVQNTASFSAFTNDLEIKHGAFHVTIGGDMMDFQHSPNSAFFYLHHAFIDKIWRDWQLYGNALKVEDINLDQVLQPWGKTARQVMELSACVDYQAQLAAASNVQQDRAFAAAPTSAEEKFNTVGEKVAAQKVIAQKKMEEPAVYQTEVKEVLKREEDAQQAARSLGAPEDKIQASKATAENVLLKGDTKVDLADAGTVINANTQAIVASGKEDLKALENGKLAPSKATTADVQKV
jgi:hypothetical protein